MKSGDSHSQAGDATVVKLANAFRARGEELYLIGGTVRDRLMGRPPSLDIDLATSAEPRITAEILAGVGMGKPYTVGQKFGTIGVRQDASRIEITTYRTVERYVGGSRKPEVEFGRSLIEDLQRRDFTINAIARDPLSGELFDPLGGREDIHRRLVRAVGVPAKRFSEDPLRLLRAVRIATELDFDIEPGTWRAMKECAPQLQRISRERIRDEYSRIISGPRPVEGLTLLRDSGLLEYSVPELLELTRMADHGPRHPLSLWDHTMRVLSHVPGDPTERWAAVLHDIAKPATRTADPDGRPRFFHHEEIGAQRAVEILSGLRYPNQIVEHVATLIETHMQVHSYSSEWSPGAVRRLVLRLGSLLPAALSLARADAAGHSNSGDSANAEKIDLLEDRIRFLDESGEPHARSPLNGDELMARYGRPPGPWIREIKTALEDEVIEGRLKPDDRSGAWKVADRIVRTRNPG
jgi:poly(A) polymerase